MNSEALRKELDHCESIVDTAASQRNQAAAIGQEARMIGLLVMEVALLRERVAEDVDRLIKHLRGED